VRAFDRQAEDPRLRWARLFANGYRAATREVLDDPRLMAGLLAEVEGGTHRRVKDQVVRAILMGVAAELWAVVGTARGMDTAEEVVAQDVARALEVLAEHVRSGAFAEGKMPPFHCSLLGREH
jgi:hypothetical protein